MLSSVFTKSMKKQQKMLSLHAGNDMKTVI